METPPAPTWIEDTVDVDSRPEEIPKASETGNDGTSNTWVSWIPDSESVKRPLRTFHRKTKTGCIRCRTRRVRVCGVFPSARDAVCATWDDI